MKKMVLAIIILSLVCGCVLEAATKQDILDLVNSQNVGDAKTAVVFNSYKTTFTRLLKQKELTSADCDKVIAYLQTTVGILNSKSVSKLSDINRLTAQEKSIVYNSLTSGATIITNAPSINGTTSDKENNISNKKNTSNTTVSINTSDGSMEIYENGMLIDKISNASSKFTYTGPNKAKIWIIVSSGAIFILAVLAYIILIRKKHTKITSITKTFIVSLIVSSGVVIVIIIAFNKYITKVEDLLSMVKYTASTTTRDVELNQDNTIKIYPSYGNNYAKLLIESLNIEKSVVYGEDTSLLSQNVCQATWSDFPTEGGVTVLSGHNNDNMLGNIEKISIGEKIVIDATYAKCTYKVYKTAIVENTESEALNKDIEQETMIIYTCYPFSEYVYGSKRFVVYASLVDVDWK